MWLQFTYQHTQKYFYLLKLIWNLTNLNRIVDKQFEGKRLRCVLTRTVVQQAIANSPRAIFLHPRQQTISHCPLCKHTFFAYFTALIPFTEYQNLSLSLPLSFSAICVASMWFAMFVTVFNSGLSIAFGLTCCVCGICGIFSLNTLKLNGDVHETTKRPLSLNFICVIWNK